MPGDLDVPVLQDRRTDDSGGISRARGYRSECRRSLPIPSASTIVTTCAGAAKEARAPRATCQRSSAIESSARGAVRM